MPAARPRTVLGFDVGLRRIGIAVGQELTATARPLVTLPTRQGQPDWPAITRLINEWRPDLCVIGVPRQADGTANTVTESALAFAHELTTRYRLDTATIDERLSSSAATSLINTHEHFSRSRRRDKATIDQVAAALILESWFQQNRMDNPCATPPL